jgi:hypothetical protein
VGEALVDAFDRLREGAEGESDFGVGWGEEAAEDADLDAGFGGGEWDGGAVEVLL